MPHHVETFVAPSARHVREGPGTRQEVLPMAYWPGDGVLDQLEFALKREGLHLGLLRALLPLISEPEITDYIKSKPTGAYARRIWYLYETFAGRRLDLPDCRLGNYADLLDSRDYWTRVGERSWRHRIDVNLLGTIHFSPMVRRTKALILAQGSKLDDECRRVIEAIPPEIYDRALQYLYTKETKSSYAIERETPDQKRLRGFSALLAEASGRDYLSKEALVELQQAIVDPRFANAGWRDTIHEQNYVGRSIAFQMEEVHFVGPKPDDLPELMSEFLASSRRLLDSNVDAVIAAAAIAYPFVFLHPFSDGNGRIHRFLIHFVLARRRFAPPGVVFPVSAAMLRRPADYDASLESISKQLMPLVDFDLDEHGRMTVRNDTRDLYRYPDCTYLAEVLYEFVRETIQGELPSELLFLQSYDSARRAMRDIVDLPNRHADLFLRLCLQNAGRLSGAKRRMEGFDRLTDEEIAALEAVVRKSFQGLPAT